MYCSSSSFCHLICILCLIVEFCAHFLHLFAPFRARFWAWILTPADIFMSCTALAAVFLHVMCILCLIVEFCAHFLHLFAPFRAWILTPAVHFVTPADIFMSWIFCASECTFCLFGSHQRTPHFGLSFGPIADFRLVCHPILGHFCSWHDFEWIFQGTHQVEQPGLCRCFGQTAARRARSPLFEEGLC